jgi:hypothetical protein
MGFDPPPRYVPKSPPSPEGEGHLSWGFFPYSASGGESPRPARAGPVSGRETVPPVPLRCRQGFPNPSATSSSLRRPAIFRRVALLGFSLQGFVPHAKRPSAHRCQCALLTFSRGLRRPPSKGDHGRASWTGSSVRRHFRLQGLPPRVRRSAPGGTVHPPQPTCPSWASASPWGPHARAAAFAARPSRFTPHLSERGKVLRSTA